MYRQAKNRRYFQPGISGSLQLAAMLGLGPFAGAAMFFASLGPCGFGPGGLYYNQPTTHTGDEAFAIDFCKFQQGVPLLNNARGTPALAIADGLVIGVESNNATGSANSGNCVRLEHMTESELFALSSSGSSRGSGSSCRSRRASSTSTGRR